MSIDGFASSLDCRFRARCSRRQVELHPPTHRETRAGYRRLSTLAMASRHFASKYGI
jgi:hypothetical protein